MRAVQINLDACSQSFLQHHPQRVHQLVSSRLRETKLLGSRKVVIGARFSLITMLWRVLMRGVILPTGRIACAIL